jgi:excinuclease UvrABC nuclease subunit
MAGSKITDPSDSDAGRDISKMDKQEIKFYVAELNEQMDLASRNLEFELAAKIRDKIAEIKKLTRLSRSSRIK